MAVTHGQGNPNWTRDETILALDLLLSCGRQIPSPRDDRVIALSVLLRKLPIHSGESKVESFLNPAGVVFKLQNLHSVATGRGLKNFSQLDAEIWNQFGSKPDVVRKIADVINQAVSDPIKFEIVTQETSEAEFNEGRIITALHNRRERDPNIRRRLIEARTRSGELMCELC